jgi:hypothetical protein
MRAYPVYTTDVCESGGYPGMALKINSFSRYFSLWFLAMAVLAFSYPAATARAQSVTSCDPQYMDALEARAWMEAQREISMNQNLILKPDSVLEYSCFESFLDHVAGQNLFSEMGCCGAEGLGPTSMDSALTTAVADALDTYISLNFGHRLRGGRSPSLDGQGAAPLIDGVVSGGSYSCDLMQRVWDEAKCANFFDEANHDGFFDFAWFYSNDPRTRNLSNPWSAANACASPISQVEANVAYNGRANLYSAAENQWPGADATPYADDPIQPRFDLLLPEGAQNPSGGTVACAPPIPTGVCVRRGGGVAEYPDAVCPNPGCHYVPAPAQGSCNNPGTVSGSCVR